MKSKSFNLSSAIPETAKLNKTFDFVNYYKTAADSNTDIKKNSKVSNNKDPSEASNTLKLGRSHSKDTKKKFKGEIMNVTKIDIDGQHLLPSRGSFSNDFKLTSTPNVSNNKNACIRSIMKGAPELENSLNLSNVSQINRKKRNKSVSFMLEEHEEVIIKKTRSDDSLESKILEKSRQKLKKNKIKNQQKEDKENNDLKIKTDNSEIDSQNTECTTARKNSLKRNKKLKTNTQKNDDSIVKEMRGDKNIASGDNILSLNSARSKKEKSNTDVPINEKSNVQKKTRSHGKKYINIAKTECDIDDKIKVESTQVIKNKQKKSGKNKHKAEASEIDEPAKKSIKKTKPDAIAEGIQNLNIGDNAHTLTHLLNGINVNSNKKLKIGKQSNPVLKLEHKVKSKKNNKKRKNRNLNAVVLVQNLPFKVLLDYKQLLKNWFSKYGTVHSVGIADLKCNKHEAKPIFTTRIFFKKEEEATLAQAEDKVLFEGNIIRVKKYAPPEARVVKLYSSSENVERQKSEEATSENSENVMEESDSDE